MDGTQWAVFEPNDQRLWTQLQISAIELPHPRLARRRAVRHDARPRRSTSSATPRRTRPTWSRPARSSVEIGIAPVKPAEFVVFRISQFAGGGGGGEEGGEE